MRKQRLPCSLVVGSRDASAIQHDPEGSRRGHGKQREQVAHENKAHLLLAILSVFIVVLRRYNTDCIVYRTFCQEKLIVT